MLNRNRMGIAVILICLLFDAFIMHYQKAVSVSGVMLSCPPLPVKHYKGSKEKIEYIYDTSNHRSASGNSEREVDLSTLK
jgi:hypothetical protein